MGQRTWSYRLTPRSEPSGLVLPTASRHQVQTHPHPFPEFTVYNSMLTSRPEDPKCVLSYWASQEPTTVPGAQRHLINAYPLQGLPAVPGLGSPDLGRSLSAAGQKGASCHAFQLKEELHFLCCDGMSMRSHVICGAWLYRAGMDGPRAGRPLGWGGIGPVSSSGGGGEGKADEGWPFLMQL